MKVIIITGQTATGKTDFALDLAKKCDGELINADSRQIYKGLDIITGKDINKYRVLSIENREFRCVRKVNDFEIGYYTLHSPYSILNTRLWLYDIIDPKQYFSSYDWVQCAISAIKEILSRGKTPIIVGGTYFYLYHLLYDVETQHIPPDWKLRNELNEKSVYELQIVLKKLAPQFINELSRSEFHNPQRLIRKIEIITYQKKHNIKQHLLNKFSSNRSIQLDKKLRHSIQIKYQGIRYKEKQKLVEAITKRVEKRLKNGAVKEAEKLLKEGYAETDPGLKTLGYRQLFDYLYHQSTLEKAKEAWINKEIQYTKRQYTFMKKDLHIKWENID